MTTYSYQPLLPYADYLQAYFSQLGGDIAVLGRVAAQFAVSETSPPGMTVRVAAGAAFRTGAVIDLPARTSATIAVPAANPRIDRVVINTTTDALLVVQGTEAATPTAPAVPAGHLPLARIALAPAMTAITNTAITDERLNGGAVTQSGGGLLNVQTFTSNGTYTPTPGTNSILVEIVGGGGSGGGCGATNGSQGSAASGGSSGSFARARFTSGFASASVVIGQGGAATNNAAVIGNSGGTSSFGALMTAPGGIGGYAGIAFVPPAVVGGALPGNAPTGGNILNALGSPSQYASILNVISVIAGVGGASVYGGAGTGGGNGPGMPAAAPGSGGGGASSVANSPARSGGAGAAGMVTVYEYA